MGIGTLIEGDEDDEDDEEEDDEDVGDIFESLDSSLDACCLYHEFSVSI